MNKFSVLMSVYKNDNPIFFEEAIKSILHQSIVPNEIVIVKDGALTTDLEEILDKYILNPLFKIISLSTNSGLGIALQKGLEACTNNIVARMDSDDIAVYTRFQEELECFENDEQLSIVGADIAEFSNEISNIISFRHVPYTDSEIKKAIKYRCPFNHMTVMYKRNVVLAVGNYQDWHFNEDYFLWIRMAEKDIKMKNINKVLVYARVDNGMYERRGGTKYFLSEKRLQKYMFEKKIISRRIYFINIFKRYVIQVLIPPKVRRWIYINIIRRTKI